MASVLQVATIKDQGGNANAIEIANSSANVTINNLAGGAIGSAVTGFTGIKTVDVWQLNTNFSGSAEPIHANTFTRATTSSGGANLGTGMTLNGSSGQPGIFTFPSTGIWRVEAGFNFNLDNSSRYIFTRIDVSTSGTGGTFYAEADSRTFINRTDSNNTFSSTYVTCTLDVTTSGTSGTAVQFDVTTDNSSTVCGGGTVYNLTYFMFTRLGDT